MYLQGARQIKLPKAKEDCVHHASLQISHRPYVMPEKLK